MILLKKLRAPILTAGSLSVARIIAAGVQLAIVPMLLPYLGAELFGTWVVLSAIPLILQVADFGVGNSMVNDIVSYSKTKKRYLLLRYILMRYQFLIMVSTIVMVLGLFLSLLPIWREFLNVSPKLSDEELQYSLIAVVLISSLQILLNANQQIWLGFQEGMRNGISLAAGAISNLCLVKFCVYANTSFSCLVFFSMTGMIFAQLYSTLLLFSKIKLRVRWLFWPLLNYKSIAKITENAKSFFLIQICGVISYHVDVFLVSCFVGSEGAAEYSVVSKIFSIPTLVVSLLLSGVWPAISSAKVMGETIWIRRTFNLTFWSSLTISAVLTLCLYRFSYILIESWTDGIIYPSENLILGFSIWVILTAVGGNIAIYLNGFGDISYQAKSAIFFSFLNIVFSLAFVKIFGVSGPVWGSVFASTIYYIFALRRIRSLMFR